MAIDDRPCPSCGSTDFLDDACGRCGRPKVQPIEYVDEIEALAVDVVVAAYKFFGDDLRRTATTGPDLQRAIVRLAHQLRHYHYEGDGCVDDDD